MTSESDTPEDVLDTERAGGLAVRGGALRVVGFAFGTVFSLVGIALVTRHLGPGRFGEFQTVIALMTIVATVTDAGMAALAVREYSQRKGEDRRRLMETLLGLRLALTVLGIVIATAIAALLGYSPAAVIGTALFGIGLLIVVVQTTFLVPLQAELRLGWVTAITVAGQALLAAVYVLLVALDAGLVWFLGATIPVNLVLAIWTLILVADRMRLRPSGSPRAWVGLLQTSIVFAAAIAAGAIYVYLAQVETEALAGAEQAGVFGVSFRVFIVVGAIPGILVASAFPLLARAARDDRARLAGAIGSIYAGMFALGGAAALVCVLGAPLIVEVVAGADFAASVDVLRIHGFALLLSFLLAPAAFALIALHRHREILIVNLTGVVVVAGLVAVLAPADGARGAAIGGLVGETLIALGSLELLRRVDPALGLRPSLALRALLAFGLGLVVLVAGLPALPATAIGLAVYAVAAVVLGVLPPAVGELVPGRAGRALTRWSR